MGLSLFCLFIFIILLNIIKLRIIGSIISYKLTASDVESSNVTPFLSLKCAKKLLTDANNCLCIFSWR